MRTRMPFPRILRSVLIFALVGLVACQDPTGSVGAGTTPDTPSAPTTPATPTTPSGTAVSSIAVNHTHETMAVGAEYSPVAVALPKNAADRTLTWTSSNPSVASVSAAGLVRGLAVGTTTLTATAGGKSATVTLTVTAPSTTIVGSYWTSDQEVKRTGYWKDDVWNELSVDLDAYPHGAEVSSLAFDGDDAYAVGVAYDNDPAGGWGHQPVLWKNGVPTYLTGAPGNYAAVVEAARGHVFVVGYTGHPDSGISVWIDGVLQGDYGRGDYQTATPSSVTLVGDDLVIVGAGSDTSYNDHPVLWRDGKLEVLPLPAGATYGYVLKALWIDGEQTIVGVAGSATEVLCGTWRGGVWTTTGTLPADFTVRGGDLISGSVVIVGTKDDPASTQGVLPAVWEDGVLTTLALPAAEDGTATSGLAASVARSGDDTVISGYSYVDGDSFYMGGGVGYWKNGTWTPLSLGDASPTYASAFGAVVR